MIFWLSLSIPFNWGDVALASGAPTGVLFWARFVKKSSKLSSKPKQQCHHPRSLRHQYFGPIWWEKLNLATSRHFKCWPWVIENGHFWPCFLGPKTQLRIYDFKLIRDPPRPPHIILGIYYSGIDLILGGLVGSRGVSDQLEHLRAPNFLPVNPWLWGLGGIKVNFPLALWGQNPIIVGPWTAFSQKMKSYNP